MVLNFSITFNNKIFKMKHFWSSNKLNIMESHWTSFLFALLLLSISRGSASSCDYGKSLSCCGTHVNFIINSYKQPSLYITINPAKRARDICCHMKHVERCLLLDTGCRPLYTNFVINLYDSLNSDNIDCQEYTRYPCPGIHQVPGSSGSLLPPRQKPRIPSKPYRKQTPTIIRDLENSVKSALERALPGVLPGTTIFADTVTEPGMVLETVGTQNPGLSFGEETNCLEEEDDAAEVTTPTFLEGETRTDDTISTQEPIENKPVRPKCSRKIPDVVKATEEAMTTIIPEAQANKGCGTTPNENSPSGSSGEPPQETRDQNEVTAASGEQVPNSEGCAKQGPMGTGDGELVTTAAEESGEQGVTAAASGEQGATAVGSGEQGATPAASGEQGATVGGSAEEGVTAAGSGEQGATPISSGEQGVTPAGSEEQGATPAASGEEGTEANNAGSAEQNPAKAGSGEENPAKAGSAEENPTKAGSAEENPTKAGSGEQSPTNGESEEENPSNLEAAPLKNTAADSEEVTTPEQGQHGCNSHDHHHHHHHHHHDQVHNHGDHSPCDHHQQISPAEIQGACCLGRYLKPCSTRISKCHHLYQALHDFLVKFDCVNLDFSNDCFLKKPVLERTVVSESTSSSKSGSSEEQEESSKPKYNRGPNKYYNLRKNIRKKKDSSEENENENESD